MRAVIVIHLRGTLLAWERVQPVQLGVWPWEFLSGLGQNFQIFFFHDDLNRIFQRTSSFIDYKQSNNNGETQVDFEEEGRDQDHRKA